MTKRVSPAKIKKEFDRLEKSGEEFTLFNVAFKLNSTSQKLAAALRMRENVIVVERPVGKYGGQAYSRYRFGKEGEKA